MAGPSTLTLWQMAVRRTPGLDPRMQALLFSCQGIEWPVGRVTLLFQSEILAAKIAKDRTSDDLVLLVQRVLGPRVQSAAVAWATNKSLAEVLFGVEVRA